MSLEPMAAWPVAVDPSRTMGRPELKQPDDAQQVSASFTALFLEQMLNASVSEDDPLTGVEKSAGMLLSEQMMHRQLAEVMAQSSPIRLTIEKQLTYAADPQ